MRILAFDPGDTTGICDFHNPKRFTSLSVEKDLLEIYNTIKERKPDLIVFERFVLYPALAQHLAWNEMYPSQVIGVIKFCSEYFDIPIADQSASSKDYVSYPKNHTFRSEHEKDAYGHAWHYYMKNGLNKKERK